MPASLVVAPERGRADRAAFLGLPYRLHRGAPGWVPPLRSADALVMNRAKNPFFAHSEAEHFLARRGDRVVGRIAAIENRRQAEFHGERRGGFGWFDVEEDPEAATALVEAARAWGKARGLTGLRGPFCYSMNDVCGTLVEGFHLPAAMAMPWNPPYYDALLRGAGLAPAKDLLAYEVDTRATDLSRLERVASRVLDRGAYTLRPIDLSRWPAEVDLLLDLYNRSWELNWGFVPMTEAEFRHAAKDLRRIVRPEVLLVLEQAGVPLGFVGVLPDVNVAIADLDGRLFPFGLFKLLRRLPKVRRCRIMLLGVVPEARGRGMVAALVTRVIAAGARIGIVEGEASWVLEDNAGMRSAIESMGSRVSKRYRIYESA